MFRAYDATRERLVAVKLFKLDLPPERAHQLVAEFERLIAADLSHPAIAAAHATGISGVSAFLVQDYVAADSLDLAVREYGPAPTVNALRVAAQLAGALDFAAAVQVTHGGLHPRDVLLSSDDTRLTGLGVTRALEAIGFVAPVRRPYTAPERIAGAAWDRRTDVFSLAALIHELISGKRVSGLGARAAEHLTGVPGADPAALQAVFARALAEEPHDRYPTALAFAEALRNACPDVALVADAPAPPKRRAAKAEVKAPEPRLPLDEAPEPTPDAQLDQESKLVQAFTSMPPDAPPDVSATIETAQEAAPIDLDIAPRTPEPDIHYQPAPPSHAPIAYDPPSPAGLIAGHDGDARSALERTRSAIWPLVLALGVGIAIGFAGGFFAGSRELSSAPATAAPAATAAPVPSAVAAPPPAAKEFTEAAVPAPTSGPANAGNTPASEPKTRKPESKTPNPPPADPGRLLVRTRPAGARVAVDGKDYGASPATVRDLAPGTHRVRITHDGYVAEERRFVISSSRPAQSITVALSPARAEASRNVKAPPPMRFAGALAVDSRPTGAKVFMDGKLVGTTPMALPSVPAGSHAIRLEHDGYRHWTSSVRVVASEQNRVTASLER